MFELLGVPNPTQAIHVLGDLFLATGVVLAFFIMLGFFYMALLKEKWRSLSYIGSAGAAGFIIFLLVMNYVWPLFFGFPI